MNCGKSIYTLLFLLLSSLWAIAQQDAIATVDSNLMTIGDIRNLTFSIKSENKPTLDLTPLAEVNQFELIDSSEWKKTNANSNIWERKYQFSIYDSGFYWLPSLIVANTHESIYTNKVGIKVAYPAADSTLVLNPIKPIILEKWHWTDALIYIYWILALLFLALISYYIYKKIKKYRNKSANEIDEQINKLPPHLQALYGIEKLKASDYWSKGAYKEFYTELTFILRTYIEQTLQIQALEMTTDELTATLTKGDFDIITKHQIDGVTSLLRKADLIKFAKAIPQDERPDGLISFAIDFVNDIHSRMQPPAQESDEEDKSVPI
ncbi:MAG: hypothetical protein KA010_03695 [Saprospiraceae bacterium]|nr:hypothetical protein [Saprospiraceae bacterium]